MSEAENLYQQAVAQLKGQGVPVNQERAFELFTQASNQHHPKAQFELAKFYDGSIGARFDRSKALQLIKASAEKSYVGAQEELAFIYLNGKPGMATRDPKQSFRWFNAAYKQSSLPAGCMLGDFYKNGWGVNKDLRQAFKIYSEAAHQVSSCAPRAQLELYEAFLKGDGIAKNSTQATYWLQKSAEGGNSRAQKTLGMNYLAGRFVPKSEELGHQWILKSREGAFPHDDELDDEPNASGHNHGKHLH